MPTSAFNKFNDFVEQRDRGVHNFGAHTFKLALTNAAPSAANTVLADITQIGATGGYTADAGGGYALTPSLSESGGTSKVFFTDLVITATGGVVGPFRYAVIYNDSSTSPVDALVGFYDYGAALTLNDGETLTLDFDGVAGAISST